MSIEIFNCEQGTPEWAECRLGIPTASCFGMVLAKARGGAGGSKTRKTYLHKLAGEVITGKPMDGYSNHHMERGHEMEGEARDAYAFIRDAEPRRVGFIRNGDIGASPDSLIGDTGLLEIKTKLAHLQIEALLSDDLPSEHKAQVQGQLFVAEREFVDFVSYWPGLPPLIKRVHREDEYIKKLELEIRVFNDELRQVVEQIRGKAA